MTPNQLVARLRVAAAISVTGLAVLLLGPFQGLEAMVHLTDKEAHAIAFFAVTLGLFAIAPKWRRTDLALAALTFGVLIELAQGLSGRSASLSDLFADGVGIFAALVPGFVERLRHHIRTAPDVEFALIRSRDRRKGQTANAQVDRIGTTRRSASAVHAGPRV